MRISDDTLDHVLKTCDDMAQPDKGNLYKLNLSSYLGERFARALAEDLRDARAALSKVPQPQFARIMEAVKAEADRQAKSMTDLSKLTADKRAWVPKEVGDALVKAGHAGFDKNSGTYYVRGSALELIRKPAR